MNPRDKIFVLLILTVNFLLLACQGESNIVKVIQVIDGDTIIIEGEHHVRYIGIDAPEQNESGYLEAKYKNKELVEGKKVRLEKDTSNKDRYGRLLRYVYINDTFVNGEIVKHGYAYARAYSPDTKYQVYLEAMENEARQKKRGIWRQQ